MLKPLITVLTLAATLGGCSTLPTSSFNPPQTLEAARAAFPSEPLAYFYYNEKDYRSTANELCRFLKIGPYKYSSFSRVLPTDNSAPTLNRHELVAVAPVSWGKAERNPHCLVNSNQRVNGWSAGWLNTTPLEETDHPPMYHPMRRIGHPFAPDF